MTGLKQVLTSALADGTGFPILRDDPVLPDTGALMLLDFAHSLAPLTTIPATGGLVRSVVRDKAAALIGGTVTDADAVFESTGMTGTAGKVEFSTKGALHAIMSTSNTSTANGMRLSTSAVMRDYLRTNAAHAFYASVWTRYTRLTTSTVLAQLAFQGPTKNGIVIGSNPWSGYTSGMVLLGNRGTIFSSPTGLALGPALRSVGVPNISEWGVQAGQPVGTSLVTLLNHHNASIYSGTNVGKHGAAVYMRAYLEDLTVSGRTYAQVDTLDFAEYTKQVLTLGGRYYNDTVPTDPTTIP